MQDNFVAFYVPVALALMIQLLGSLEVKHAIGLPNIAKVTVEVWYVQPETVGISSIFQTLHLT